MALSVADTLNTELDMTRTTINTATTPSVTERHTTEVTEEKYQLLKRRLKEITEVIYNMVFFFFICIIIIYMRNSMEMTFIK